MGGRSAFREAIPEDYQCRVFGVCIVTLCSTGCSLAVNAMRIEAPWILPVMVCLLVFAWYRLEPWSVTFVDDGPYYSSAYPGQTEDLALQSQVELRRPGWLVYRLESRRLPGRDASVLVLRDASGAVQWVREPVKPDGELGSVELRRSHLWWDGGWRIRIVPSNQEPGDLYIGPLGGFRFFNHSW